MSKHPDPGTPSRWVAHTVAADEAGQTVQQILQDKLGISGRMIQRLTRADGLRLNRNQRTYLEQKLREGDVVSARVGAPDEAGLVGVAMPLEIVHEDADLLVIDKPAGLLVHPVLPTHHRTLAHGVAHHLRAQGLSGRVHPLHRLDRDTSGLVLFAKSPLVHGKLDRQMARREIHREYLAWTEGRLAASEGMIDAVIGRNPANPALRTVRPDGDPARTHFRLAELFPNASRVELKLETGRTHQIRVHLLHLGHPVLGDRQYGQAGLELIVRQALHAHRLGFRHPTTAEAVEFTAPVPPDLQELEAKLRGE